MSLHLALEGHAAAPLEWWLSRICEEFGCLPSEAWREWQRLPAGMLETILAFRAYARAKAAYDAKGRRAPADPPLLETVTEIAFALVRWRTDETGTKPDHTS